MAIRIPQRNPVIESLWQRMERDFAEHIAGTTIPDKPAPYGVEHPSTRSGKLLPVMPIPEFPPHGGSEL